MTVGTLNRSMMAKTSVSGFVTQEGMDEEGGGKLASDMRIDLNEGFFELQGEPESHGMSPEELKPLVRGMEVTSGPPEMDLDAPDDRLRENKVAIKILEWNRGDLRQSKKFFKVLSVEHDLC